MSKGKFLAPTNRTLEGTGQLPPDLWNDWLWRSDPEEALAPSVLLNRSHLLGLLICRQRAGQRTTPDPTASDPRLILMPTKVADIQKKFILSWPQPIQ